MRLFLAIILALTAGILGICAALAVRTKKRMAPSVCSLLIALIPPVLGNMIILLSENRTLSLFGYYFYFLGMNMVSYALLIFTFRYCSMDWPHPAVRKITVGLLIADAVQLLANLFTGHAFALNPIEVEGRVYYALLPHFGQTVHRVLDYGIFAIVLIIFLVRFIRSPRIYAERYWVILLTMIIVGLWETFYIFSGTPMDSSMVGFGVFGLMIYYFSLHYRPMRLLDRMLIRIASQQTEAYFFFDAMGRPLWANETGEKMIGVAPGELDGLEEALHRVFGFFPQNAENWKDRRVVETPEGKKYYLLDKQTMTEARRGIMGSFLIVRDKTEDEMALERERYIASHDSLTGLYTRKKLYEEIQSRIAEQPDREHMILLTDVDNFKIVNDIFGNAFGDLALVQIANMIREMAGEEGIYGRIAGDTFGICIPSEKYNQHLMEERLHHFTVEDGKISHHLQIHIGAYVVKEKGLTASVMFDRARLALAAIKDDGNALINFYSGQMREDAIWDQYITGELAGALEKKQIQPYLQPIVDQQGKPIGAEALVRWIHPTLGFLAPYKFVPVFEQNGMIADVDRFMWRSACEILARWKREGIDLFLSVNVSPKDFYFMNVVTEIENAVREFGVDPGKLRIEITETVMMTDLENRVRMLNELKKKGFLIEMDDFGSGFSSLNMLKDMPIDLIKMDMAFLRQSTDDAKSRTILQSILRLSEELGITSLSEGVETEEQYRMLAERGCSLFQGYYFAKPMPVPDYEEYVRKRLSKGKQPEKEPAGEKRE